MSIRLYITGGTIDKVCNQTNGELEFNQTHFPEMLSRARIEVEIKTEILLFKDSLDMDDNDRKLILKSCVECEEERNTNNSRNRYNVRDCKAFRLESKE